MKEPGSVTKTFIRMWDLYQICYQMPFFNRAPVTGLFLNIPWSKPLWMVWFRSSPPSLLLYSSRVILSSLLHDPPEACFMWVLNMKRNSYEDKLDIARCGLLPSVWHAKKIRIAASACSWCDEPSPQVRLRWLFAWKYRTMDSPGWQISLGWFTSAHFPWSPHPAGITGEVGHEGMLH